MLRKSWLKSLKRMLQAKLKAMPPKNQQNLRRLRKKINKKLN